MSKELYVDVCEVLSSDIECDYSTIDRLFFNSEYSPKYSPLVHIEFLNRGIIVEYVDNYGGEGMGEEYWSVYKFTRGDESVYIKFDGWYQSYNGSEFTERFRVEPREVMRTDFVKV